MRNIEVEVWLDGHMIRKRATKDESLVVLNEEPWQEIKVKQEVYFLNGQQSFRFLECGKFSHCYQQSEEICVTLPWLNH